MSVPLPYLILVEHLLVILSGPPCAPLDSVHHVIVYAPIGVFLVLLRLIEVIVLVLFGLVSLEIVIEVEARLVYFLLPQTGLIRGCVVVLVVGGGLRHVLEAGGTCEEAAYLLGSVKVLGQLLKEVLIVFVCLIIELLIGILENHQLLPTGCILPLTGSVKAILCRCTAAAQLHSLSLADNEPPAALLQLFLLKEALQLLISRVCVLEEVPLLELLEGLMMVFRFLFLNEVIPIKIIRVFIVLIRISRVEPF